MTPRRRSRRIALAAAAVLAALGAAIPGCGDAGAPPAPYAEPDTVTVAQIILTYRGPDEATKGRKRSREEATELARSLIARIRGGESMELLTARHTDDRDVTNGQPFNSGTVTIARRAEGLRSFQNLVFRLKVGELFGEPVDVGEPGGYAVLVVRREL